MRKEKKRKEITNGKEKWVKKKDEKKRDEILKRITRKENCNEKQSDKNSEVIIY